MHGEGFEVAGGIGGAEDLGAWWRALVERERERERGGGGGGRETIIVEGRLEAMKGKRKKKYQLSFL